MATNNQGIFHLRVGNDTACKARNAIMYIHVDEFRAHTGLRCKRCVAKLAKMDAVAAKRAARLAGVQS
jgi:hypothetical protein